MAENKKSFLLYCDVKHTVDHLSDEQAGKLFKHILSYVNDDNPTTKDVLINLAFEPIKQQLKRDLKKYEGIIERNKVNGLKGGRPTKPKKPSGLIQNPKKPKKADTVNDSDTVNETVIDISNKLDKIKTEFFELSDSYFEALAMNKKTSLNTVKQLAQNFWLKNYFNGTDDNNLNDIRRHFGNWMDKQEIKKGGKHPGGSIKGGFKPTTKMA